MFTTRALLAILTVGVLLSPSSFAGGTSTSDKQQLAQSLQKMVNGIVKGSDLADATSHIDVEAYLIDGKQFESLLGVLHGESSHCKLVEGSESKIVFQSLKIMDSQSAAFLVVKTQTPSLGERFHSVVFFKDPDSQWRIKSWHISN